MPIARLDALSGVGGWGGHTATTPGQSAIWSHTGSYPTPLQNGPTNTKTKSQKRGRGGGKEINVGKLCQPNNVQTGPSSKFNWTTPRGKVVFNWSPTVGDQLNPTYHIVRTFITTITDSISDLIQVLLWNDSCGIRNVFRNKNGIKWEKFPRGQIPPTPSPSTGIFSTKYRFFLKMSQSENF